MLLHLVLCGLHEPYSHTIVGHLFIYLSTGVSHVVQCRTADLFCCKSQVILFRWSYQEGPPGVFGEQGNREQSKKNYREQGNIK